MLRNFVSNERVCVRTCSRINHDVFYLLMRHAMARVRGGEWTGTVLLWEADSDILEKRRGVRVFRHGFEDKAAQIAEAMTDDQMSDEV